MSTSNEEVNATQLHRFQDLLKEFGVRFESKRTSISNFSASRDTIVRVTVIQEVNADRDEKDDFVVEFSTGGKYLRSGYDG